MAHMTQIGVFSASAGDYFYQWNTIPQHIYDRTKHRVYMFMPMWLIVVLIGFGQQASVGE